jgi:hypothetical protein
MAKKTLIPAEKWEGLRHAMEEAAGTKKRSETPGPPQEAEGEAARPKQGKKTEKKEKKKEKKKERKEKKKKKGKKGKGKKKKGGKKKGKG